MQIVSGVETKYYGLIRGNDDDAHDNQWFNQYAWSGYVY